MKKALIFILILSLCTIFSGCSGGEADARQVLEKYTQSLQQGDYETAYSLLTSYDQGNISKELFVEWQSTVSKILSIERIDIDKKVDKFKNWVQSLKKHSVTELKVFITKRFRMLRPKAMIRKIIESWLQMKRTP